MQTMETVKKNDFIELDFTGRANGSIFDTTKKEEAKELNAKPEDIKPLIVCVGQGMVVSGFDSALEGKEIGKSYFIKLTSEQSFGKRKANLVRILPIKSFLEKNVNPQAGMMLALDNFLVKIISVSGGRVTVDFNNPLSGKDIEYDFTILRKVDKIEDKVSCLTEFFFKMPLKFRVENNKVVFEEKKLKPLVDIFKNKFKEILNLEVDFEDKKEEKQKEEKAEKKEEHNHEHSHN